MSALLSGAIFISMGAGLPYGCRAADMLHGIFNQSIDEKIHLDNKAGSHPSGERSAREDRRQHLVICGGFFVSSGLSGLRL